MKFKLDENMPASSVVAMVEKGFDTETVYSQGLQGATDGHLVSICKEENRALVTLDLDFANIAAFPPQKYPGILVLRPHIQSVMVIQGLIQKLLSALETDDPTGSLWIIEPNRIRIASFKTVDSLERSPFRTRVGKERFLMEPLSVWSRFVHCARHPH